jgi:hypothetical protein
VDFISYAHFEAYTKCSLEKMDKAWSVIHKTKNIFLKFHSLIHYVSTIHLHGALDGYNMESPEHLHIDFIKVPFRVGNKQDYTAQMVTWMACQEAVWCHEMFLCWAKGEGITKNNKVEAGSERKQKWKKDDVEVRGSSSYWVVKTPGYGNMTVDVMVNKFCPANKFFIWYLEEFLMAQSTPIPLSYDIPFGIFKCLSVMLPQIPQVTDLAVLRDMIRMILPKPPQDWRKAVAAQFDTVLALEKGGLTAFSDPSDPFKGLLLLFPLQYNAV